MLKKYLRRFFSSTSAFARDFKTYRHYIYAVSEGSGGVQIIDMSSPDSPRLVKTWGQSRWGNAHNLALDTETGTLYPCGTDNGMLTPTLKLKRRNVLAKYGDDLEGLYG